MDKEILKHFCVTVYIFDKETEKFVFLKHKKLQKWLPAGGHIEENENPIDAARREVFEETGIKNINFISADIKTGDISNLLINPFGIQLNKIKENHEHFDLIYLATIDKKEELVLNLDESDGIQEYNLEEILNPDFDTFDNPREWCKYFMDYLNY